MENQYIKQAEDFCKKYGVTVTIAKAENQSAPAWAASGEKHGFKYNITIEREDRKPFIFEFWDSIHNREQTEAALQNNLSSFTLYKKYKAGEFNPSAYDVLACLTKYDPETFEDFCQEYGYSEDSIKALSTFQAVDKEWHNVRRMFSDCLEDLREIE